jgi:uncharacterized protein with HEPN domain
MSRHDPIIPVRQMLDHAREAVEMARGRTRSDMDADRQFNLALARLVEIIGEAAARVQEDFRSRHPDVPWHEAIGTRNRLIHGYDVVDFDILWEIVQHELPPLIRALEAIVQEAQ